VTDSKTIGIGLLGLGGVGSGVARVLTEKGEQLTATAGAKLVLRRVLVRDLTKERDFPLPANLLTTDLDDVLADPSIDILVEVLGGQTPANEYILRAVSAGKHVVTANKDVMARYGPAILEAAAEQGVQVLYEASVGGGTPIIGPLQRDLAANEIIAVNGIVNGTTNYILTRMAHDGVDFAEALKEAQDLGYAEPDPTNDVEGIDAAYKLAVLASLAFQAPIVDTDVYHEGITSLTARDFLYGRELGYTIKLMAMARRDDHGIEARVHPVLIPVDTMIAKVDGVLNAVEVETDLAGKVLFHGQGAGAMPTTSAILADVITITKGQMERPGTTAVAPTTGETSVKPMADVETKYYIRMNIAERPGVLAQITRVFGDLQISIASVIQKEIDFKALRAEIVIVTNRARESSIQNALQDLAALEVVLEIGTMIRVED